MKAFYLYLLGFSQAQKLAKVLTDSNFEHDTQATSGHTTGDWFLMFCDKESCNQGHLDTWDDLYGRLRGKATVAYVDLDQSPKTKERFDVQDHELPQVTYIRQG